jgi:ferredoxin
MRVCVDKERCIACGACEDICPDVFELGSRDVARVLVDDAAPWKDCVLEAEESCPQEAISVCEDGEGAG